MRKSRASDFATSTRHGYHLELTLEFDAPTSYQASREVARRLMDALQLSTAPSGQDERHLQSARLICHDLRRIVALNLPPASPEASDAH